MTAKNKTTKELALFFRNAVNAIERLKEKLLKIQYAL